MKFFLALSISLFSFTSLADTKSLSCVFESLSKEAQLTVSIDNFSDSKFIALNYEQYTDYDGEPAAFSYDGDELEWLWLLSLSWDGQSIEINDKGNMVISLDSDGCDVGNIYLYANSDFQFGYLSLEHNCSGPSKKQTYSKAKCKLVSI